MRTNQKKAVILTALIMSLSSLHADWDPDYLDRDISAVETQNFQKLKNEVIKFLQNSWCSEEKANLLMDLVVLTKPQVSVEIGAFTGSSLLPVAATLKYLNTGRVFAIDAWSNAEAIKHLDADDPNRAWWSIVDMNAVFNYFQKTLKDWDIEPYCTVIRSPSEKAFQLVDNIDFLHIDGDYSEVSSLRDVQLYIPRVKSGGYVLISNALIYVNNTQPKKVAFRALFDTCEMICAIDNDNTVLFRKD